VNDSESEIKNMSLDEIIETQNELKENCKKN
jgi:ribosomal protein L29